MKNTYVKPELLMTPLSLKDIITLSGNNIVGQPDNDQGAPDGDWI